MKKLILSILAIVSLQTVQVQSAAFPMPAWKALNISKPAIMKSLGYASVGATAVAGYFNAKNEIKSLASKADERVAEVIKIGDSVVDAANNAVAVGAHGVKTINNMWNLAQILGPKYGVYLDFLTKEQRQLIGLSPAADVSWYNKLLFKSGYWFCGIVAVIAQSIAAQAIQSALIYGVNRAVGASATVVRLERNHIVEQSNHKPDTAPVPSRMLVRRR